MRLSHLLRLSLTQAIIGAIRMKYAAKSLIYIQPPRGKRFRAEILISVPREITRPIKHCQCWLGMKGIKERRKICGHDSLQCISIALQLIRKNLEELHKKGNEIFLTRNDTEPAGYLFSYFGDWKFAPREMKSAMKKLKKSRIEWPPG